MNKIISLLCICFCLCACSKSSLENTIVSEDMTFIDIYSDFSMEVNAKRMALIYLDEDTTPELLLLKNGEYELYTVTGDEVKAIPMLNPEIKINAYGPKHSFEDSEKPAFYWFEYVPYKGLIRVHGGNEKERHDYYLKYMDGVLATQLETNSKEYEWFTYENGQELSREEFAEKLSVSGYNELVPCGYLYEDVTSAYENMGRVSDTKQVLEDFISGKREALCYVEEIGDIPEEGFVTKSFQELYEEMIAGDELWGKLEYTDYDNDGEDELIIHGYVGSRMFFDVIGDTIYVLLHTGSTTDNASVAEINNKRVIERTDLLHAGRKYYRIMKYDSCCCIVDWFCLSVSFEGEHYTEKDVYNCDDKTISMEEFEAFVNGIQNVDTETEKSFTGKYHIESENKIYFRQYSDDSVYEENIGGNYNEIKEAPKQFVSLNEAGELTKLFEDDGYGSVYLLDGRLFSQYITKAGESKVYSCDFDGDNRIIWSSEEILDKAEDSFLICKTSGGGLALIDDNGERIIEEDSVQYLGCFDNIVYYSIQNEETTELYSTDLNEEKKKITSLSASIAAEKGNHESDMINIVDLDVCGDYLAFAAGDYHKENAYYDGVIILCKLDGTEKKVFYSNSLKYSFYNEGNKKAFLYEDGNEVKCVTLAGEMLETFERIPTYSVLDTYRSVSGYIMHTDEKKTYLYAHEYEELLEEIESIRNYPSDFNEIKNAEIIDNQLFFNIVLENESTSEASGRKRLVTYEYVKNLSTGVITCLYEY